jgi:demethoxyubiquinone hydroxylase (CLK1/Coq7/Cat5 family)
MTNVIQTSTFELKEDNSSIYHRIREKHVHFEDELHRLKEVTSILELALWKMRMNEKSHQDTAT